MLNTLSKLIVRAGWAGLVSLWSIAYANGQASITDLGFLHPHPFGFSEATGVSRDGKVVVGADEGRAFRWTEVDGMQHLGFLPQGEGMSYWPVAVSDDGVFATGWARGAINRSIRWTLGQDAEDLGYIDSAGQGPSTFSWDMTGDGQTIIGRTTDGGFIWDPVQGMRLAGFSVDLITRDGGVIIGSNLEGIIRWTQAGGTEVLPRPVGSTTGIYGVSDDGNVIVLRRNGSPSTLRWTRETGFAPMPRPYGFDNGHAYGISGDGMTVVGQGFSVVDNYAWIWQYGGFNGRLWELLAMRGVDLEDWEMMDAVATAASADGNVIVGYGRRASDGPIRRAWMVKLGNCGTADFNRDGDSATDADIEAFFACLAGSCCETCHSADFNADGDAATDADIESFFRVLAGTTC